MGPGVSKTASLSFVPRRPDSSPARKDNTRAAWREVTAAREKEAVDREGGVKERERERGEREERRDTLSAVLFLAVTDQGAEGDETH